MRVKPGKEDAYLSIEKEWREIHNELARQGKFNSWALWKVADPKDAGYDFITVKYFDSLSDCNNEYDWEEIEGFFGKDKLGSLFRRTQEARTKISSTVWQLADYTMSLVPSKAKPAFPQAMIGYLKVTPGKEENCEKMEKTVFSKFWQKVAAKDPRFIGWRFAKKVSPFKEGLGQDYMTIHLLDSKLTAPSQKQTDELHKQVWKEAGLPDFKSLNVKGLRTMVNVVTINKVLETQLESNPVQSYWGKMLGNWKASLPDGGYRIKRISPGHEDLEIYDKNGKLEGKSSCVKV
ncbi:MAG: hypothetical protein EXS36_10870 [Pedosphaera sp.]|nr:hypothetical protein [Pedosphaera sp.]